jgi:hypothetical protein
MNRIARVVASLATAGIVGVALLAPTSAANFGITRIALAFSDDKPATVVERDGKLAAQAEIGFTGNGLLRATWEVAGPNPDGNNPRFRVLAEVQQPLGGRDAATVKGPRLPTDSTGAYLVRLRITEPATSLDLPVIRYSVIEKKAS